MSITLVVRNIRTRQTTYTMTVETHDQEKHWTRKLRQEYSGSNFRVYTVYHRTNKAA